MKIDGHEERQAFVASQVKQIQKVWTTGPIQFVFFSFKIFFVQYFCSNEGWSRGRMLCWWFCEKNIDNVCYCNTTLAENFYNLGFLLLIKLFHTKTTVSDQKVLSKMEHLLPIHHQKRQTSNLHASPECFYASITQLCYLKILEWCWPGLRGWVHSAYPDPTYNVLFMIATCQICKINTKNYKEICKNYKNSISDWK